MRDPRGGDRVPDVSGLPLPRPDDEVVVVPAPGSGPGNWAGAPSALPDGAGGWVIAYRVRTPATRGGSVVVATSPDGEQLSTVATLSQDRFGAESLERPALVRLPEGGWRLYVSCATPGTKHWRIDALDAAERRPHSGTRRRAPSSPATSTSR